MAVELKNGKLVSKYRSVDDSKYKIISDIADPIHFGDWSGLVTQIIWFENPLYDSDKVNRTPLN